MVLLKDFILLVGVAILATCSSQEVAGRLSGRDAGSLDVRGAEKPIVKQQQEPSTASLASKSSVTTKSMTTTGLPTTGTTKPSSRLSSSTTTRKGSKSTGVPASHGLGKQDSQLDKWEKMIMNFVEQLKNTLSDVTGNKKNGDKQKSSKHKNEKSDKTASKTSISTSSTLSSTSTKASKPSKPTSGSPSRDSKFPRKDESPSRKLSERDAALQSFLSEDSDRAAKEGRAGKGPYNDRNYSSTSPQRAPHTSPNGIPGTDLKPKLSTGSTSGTTPKGSSDILTKSSHSSSIPSQDSPGIGFVSVNKPKKSTSSDTLYPKPEGPGAASHETQNGLPLPESQRQDKSHYPSRNGRGRGRQRQRAKNSHRNSYQRRHHQGSYLPSQRARAYGLPAGRVDSPKDMMGYPKMRYGDSYSNKMYAMSAVPMDGVPLMRGAAPAVRPPPSFFRSRGLYRRQDLTTDKTNSGVLGQDDPVSQGLPDRPNQYKPSRPGYQSKPQWGKSETKHGSDTRPHKAGPLKQKSNKPTSGKPLQDPNSSSRFNNHHEMIQMQRRLAAAKRLASRAANPAGPSSGSQDHSRSPGRGNANSGSKPGDVRAQIVKSWDVYPRMSEPEAEAHADAAPEAQLEASIYERSESFDDGLFVRDADAEADAEAEAGAGDDYLDIVARGADPDAEADAEAEAEAEAADISELVARDAEADAEAEAEADAEIYVREADPDADPEAAAEAVMAISKIPINSPAHNLVGEA